MEKSYYIKIVNPGCKGLYLVSTERGFTWQANRERALTYNSVPVAMDLADEFRSSLHFFLLPAGVFVAVTTY